MFMEAGFFVGLGMLLTMAKCNWTWRMRILSNPLKVDLLVFTVMTFLHWGTFSGVMAATVGAFMASLLLSVGRMALGYITKTGDYKPGWFNISHKL